MGIERSQMSIERVQTKHGLIRTLDFFPTTQSLSLNLKHSTQSSLLNYQHSTQSPLLNPRGSALISPSLILNTQHIFIDVSTELLRRGQSVRFRAPGLSMHPAIKEGETITVVPISPFNIKRGDILLYLAGRKVIAHRLVGIEKKKGDSSNQSSTQYPAQSPTQSSKYRPRLFLLRGDASAICDEPVEAQQILGKVVSVERDGRSINLCSIKARILHNARMWASYFKRLILRPLRKRDQIFIFDKKQEGDLL